MLMKGCHFSSPSSLQEPGLQLPLPGIPTWTQHCEGLTFPWARSIWVPGASAVGGGTKGGRAALQAAGRSLSMDLTLLLSLLSTACQQPPRDLQAGFVPWR